MRGIVTLVWCVAIVALLPQTLAAQTGVDGAVRAGTWIYTATTTGSQASFSDASRQPLLTIRCTRAVRRVTVEARSGPAPTLRLWTSTASRSLVATHNPASGMLSAELQAQDNLLDALAFSRGRISVGASGAAPIVVPAWPEPARAIEDCRN